MFPQTRDNRGSVTIAVQTLFTVLAFIVVFLRVYTRFFLIRSPGPEDYTIILSMTCSILLTMGYGIQVKYGIGQHVTDIPQEFMVPLFKWLYFSIVVYCLNLGITKISIVLQLIRVFGTAGGTMARVYWLSLGVMMLYTMYSLSAGVFTCWPVQYWWDTTIPNGTCKQKDVLWYLNNGLNIVTDIWIITLPIPVLRSLHLPRSQKVGLAVVFLMGFCVCIISILRIPALIESAKSTDFTYDDIKLGIYSSVEVNVGIICASLPALKALFPRLLSAGSKSGYSSRPTARDDTKLFERYGVVESSAWRSFPMDRLSKSRSGDEENGSRDRGIKVTTSVAQAVYNNASNEDGLSLTESEHRLVNKA